MAETQRTILLNLNVNTSQYVKNITESKIVVEKLKEEQSILLKKIEAVADKGSASYKKLTKALVENQAELRGANEEMKKGEKSLDSYNKLQVEQAKALRLTGQTTSEARAEVKLLNDVVGEAGQIAEENFGTFTEEQNKIILSIVDTKNKLVQLEAQNKSLGDVLATSQDKGSIAYRKTQVALQQNEVAIKSNKGQLTNLNKELDNSVKINKASEGSYESLYRQYVQAEIKLKNLAGTLKQNADGTFELTREYKKASKDVLNLKEGVLKFNEGIKDGRLNVGNYKDAIKSEGADMGFFSKISSDVQSIVTATSSGIDLAKQSWNVFTEGVSSAVEGIKSFSVSVGDGGATSVGSFGDEIESAGESAKSTGTGMQSLGNKTKIATSVGASGFKILRLAIASTGIGLLVIALASIIIYFTKFAEGMKGIRVITAQVGAVIDSLIGTLGKIGEAITSLSWNNFKEAVSGSGKAMAEASKNAKELELRTIALEERELSLILLQGKRKIEAEDYRKIQQDKTKTDKERIDASDKAGQIEKQILADEVKTERERLALIDRRLAQKIKEGKSIKEELKERQDLKVALLNLEDDLADKERDNAIESSKIRKSFQAERISAELGLLNNELATKELYGKKDFALQRDIANKERIAKLSDTTLSDEAILKIESDHTLQLLRIDKEQSDSRKLLRQELDDSRFSIIIDGQTREIAIESEGLKRRLSEIKGNGEIEKEQRKLTAIQSADAIIEIQRKYAEKSMADINSQNQRQAKMQEDEVNKQATSEQNFLEIAFSKKEILQQDFDAKLLLVEQKRLLALRDIQTKELAIRLENEKNFFDNLQMLQAQNLSNGTIDAFKYAERIKQIQKEKSDAILLTEQTGADALTQTNEAITQNKVNQTIQGNEAIIENEQRTHEQKVAIYNAQLDATGELFSAIAGLLSDDVEKKKKYAIVLKALAIADVLIGLQKEIAGYWEGAGKDSGGGGNIIGGTISSVLAGVKTAAATIRSASAIKKITATKFEEGGFTMEDAFTRYNAKVSPSFAGGYLNSPTLWSRADGTMNLGGEAGREYVSPNWQLAQAPQLFSALENWRKTGVRPFVDGGFTSSTFSQPILQSTEAIENAIARGFTKAPSPQVSVVEINTMQKRVETIETRGNLR